MASVRAAAISSIRRSSPDSKCGDSSRETQKGQNRSRMPQNAWPEPVERVAEVLRAAGVDARVEEFPAGTKTARDAAEAVGCELSQIVKTLVVVADGAFLLVLIPGDERL